MILEEKKVTRDRKNEKNKTKIIKHTGKGLEGFKEQERLWREEKIILIQFISWGKKFRSKSLEDNLEKNN